MQFHGEQCFREGRAFRIDYLALAFSACLLFSFMGMTDARAATETVLHSFDDNGIDGYNPTSALIRVKGSLYGTTSYGGAYGYGTVFSVDPKTGTESVLYSFGASSSDGRRAAGTLLNVGDILYGTTAEGGTVGAGTIFELDPATATETVLYNFLAGGTDGDFPLGPLTLVNGVFYGTTVDGGAHGQGTVFSFDGKNETVLYSFRGAQDGAAPNGGVAYEHGTLYGTTEGDGLYGGGVVFSFNLKSKQENVMHSFPDNSSDGIDPQATVISANGLLYGTTAGGGAYRGGTVYSVNPKTGSEEIVYSFCTQQNCPDGSQPNSALIDVGGTLYGTSNGGGTYEWGAVFSFDPQTEKEKVLHSFDDNGTDGALPYTALLHLKKDLYGTTAVGGTSTTCRDGCGTVFQIRP